MTDPNQPLSHRTSISEGPQTADTLDLSTLRVDGDPSNAGALARWLVVVAVTFGVLVAGFLWISRPMIDSGEASAGSSASAGSGPRPAEVNYPVPDFRLASLSGETLGPLDFEGQAVVIDFWATWCGPCKIQAKMLEVLHEEMSGKGVQFLAINVGEDLEMVQNYVEKTPFSYDVLLDPNESLSAKYQIYGLPTVMVVNRQGKISYLNVGLTDVPTLRKVLAKAGVER